MTVSLCVFKKKKKKLECTLENLWGFGHKDDKNKQHTLTCHTNVKNKINYVVNSNIIDLKKRIQNFK